MLVAVSGVHTAMAVEEAAYEVTKKDGRFEIREYAPQVLADVMIGKHAEFIRTAIELHQSD